MSRFNCNDCCLNNTESCRFGANKSNDYCEWCPDLLVEQNVAYEKAIEEFVNYAFLKGIDFSFMGRIMENGESDVPIRLKKIKDDFLEQKKGTEIMAATDKEIKEQLEFTKVLVKRLDENQGVTTLRADIKRVRRELNELSKMTQWDYRPIVEQLKKGKDEYEKD